MGKDDERALTDLATTELDTATTANIGTSDYTLVIDADTGKPYKMLISEFDKLIT